MRNAIGFTRILGTVLLLLAVATPLRAGIISIDMPASASPGDPITVAINMSGMPPGTETFNFQVTWDADDLDYVGYSLGSDLPPGTWGNPTPGGPLVVNLIAPDSISVATYDYVNPVLGTAGNIFNLLFDVKPLPQNAVTSVFFATPPYLNAIGGFDPVVFDVFYQDSDLGGELIVVNDSMNINGDPAVPEPASLMVCLLGVAAFSTVKRFRNRRQRAAQSA